MSGLLRISSSGNNGGPLEVKEREKRLPLLKCGKDVESLKCLDCAGERVMTGGAAPSSVPPPVGANAACAACKYQRRKCAADCPLAPYFPPDQPKRFLNVHRLFGVSSILRILRQVDPDKREDTVKSIVYEADTREKDPVHGCLGIIQVLQNQVNELKEELAVARHHLYLLEQQHASSFLHRGYAHQHPGNQANLHNVYPQYNASTSQGQGGHGSFHDPVPGNLMTYQDSRVLHGAYHDHARYLADQDSTLQDIIYDHPIKLESDPYSRSIIGNMRYVPDSGGLLHVGERHQNPHNFASVQQGGSTSYALGVSGELDSRSFYNPPLADTHLGRHVDPLRSVAALQGLDPLNSHSSHVADPELRNAGVHLSLTNQ